MKRKIGLADWQWSALGTAIILAVWQLYGTFSNPFFVPSFTRVLGELRDYIADGSLIVGLLQTFELLVIGLSLGALAGIPVGLVLGVNRTASEILAPYIQAAYATPRIALIPVVIIFLGVGFQAQIALVFLQCFFEILIATEAGAREVSGQYLEVARSFRVSSLKRFVSVVMPGSFPFIVSGLRLGLANAFVGAIGAELFLESTGVGGIVKLAAQSFRTDRVLANVLVLAVIAVALMTLMRYWARRSQPWRQETFE